MASILSNPCKYALQALVHLARREKEGSIPLREVAEEEGIPASFLAKVLQQLARQKMLRSSKGPGGGFAFRIPPAQISVLDIVRAVDGLDGMEACVMRTEPCDAKNPCPMHEAWTAIQDRVYLLMKETSLADLAAGGPKASVLRAIGPIKHVRRK